MVRKLIPLALVAATIGCASQENAQGDTVSAAEFQKIEQRLGAEGAAPSAPSDAAPGQRGK